MSEPWVIMPVLAAPVETEAAISDVLAQTMGCRLLVVNQGIDTPFRQHLERIAEAYPSRVFVWSHVPPLASLAATWNRALDFAWETGAHAALVIGNDVRLAPNTLRELDGVMGHCDPYVVTGVGVSPEQFTPGEPVPPVLLTPPDKQGWGQPLERGGPDFSCFYISRQGHHLFRFDEGFIPAYCEDCSLHREMMLAGEGHRIYSVNVPFGHIGSITLKTVDAKTRSHIERLTQTTSRAHYLAKWGGAVNEERYTVPFDPTTARDGVTTPDLFAEVQRGQDDRPAQTQRPAAQPRRRTRRRVVPVRHRDRRPAGDGQVRVGGEDPGGHPADGHRDPPGDTRPATGGGEH
jgi:hypothetical protein